MSSQCFPTKIVNGLVIDAFASDIATSFHRIMKSSSSADAHLLPAKTHLSQFLSEIEHKVDTPADLAALTYFIRASNRTDFIVEHEGRYAYPADDVFENINLSIEHAKGFNLDTSEGLAHFGQALREMAYNTHSAEKMEFMRINSTAKEPHALSNLSLTMTNIAIAAHPDLENLFNDYPSPDVTARSLVSVMSKSHKLYANGCNIKEQFDIFDVSMSFLTSTGSSRMQIEYGEDILMELYHASLLQPIADKTGGVNEITVPFSITYGTKKNPTPIKQYRSLTDYFENNYKTDKDVPEPTLVDAGHIQVMFERLHSFYSNLPSNAKLVNVDGSHLHSEALGVDWLVGKISSIKHTHGHDLSEILNSRLSPSMNYEQAIAAWNEKNDKNTPLYIVFENADLHGLFTADIHQTILNVRHKQGVVMFTDQEQAHNYMFHLTDNLHAHPFMATPMCSMVDLRQVPVAKFWQLESVKRSLENLGSDSISHLSASQRFNLVLGIAANQNLHIPDALKPMIQDVIERNVYIDDWAKVVTHAMYKAPKDVRDQIQMEFSSNAPIKEEPDIPNRPDDGHSTLSKPKLSPM